MQAFLSIYELIDWVIRSVAMVSLALIIGGITFLKFTLPVLKLSLDKRLSIRRFTTTLLFYSAIASGVTQLVAGSALTIFLSGSTQANFPVALTADAVMIRLSLAAVAFIVAWSTRRQSRLSEGLLLFLAAVLVGGHTGITHAASRVDASPALFATEMLHLAAMGTWIAGLPYLIAALKAPIDAGGERLFIAARFSIVAVVAVTVMVTTGVVMSIPCVGSFGNLYQTNYGLLVVTKVALLALLLSMGAVNFFAIRKTRKEAPPVYFRQVEIPGETEVAVGFIAILCAVALANSTLAANTRAERPTATEIISRFDFAMSQGLRHLARISDGVTARVFSILNELAIEAIRAGAERITDDDIESWKPTLEKETVFA